jgi:hypothetical protein
MPVGIGAGMPSSAIAFFAPPMQFSGKLTFMHHMPAISLIVPITAIIARAHAFYLLAPCSSGRRTRTVP